MSQKTTHIDTKYAQKRRSWVLLDGKGAVLGRLATKAAVRLRGKHRSYFSPSVDCGDFVVVTNAEKVRLTGKKTETKQYFRHSGYAGGAKIIPFKDQMLKDPTKVVYLAVKRMLPANRLRSRQLKRLKIYSGDGHPHAAQKLEALRV